MAFEFTEYSRIGIGESEVSNMLHSNQLATQQLTPTNTSLQSAEFQPETSMVYMTVTDTAVRVAFGEDPIADRVAPGLSQLFPPGQHAVLVPKRSNYKLAVINA